MKKINKITAALASLALFAVVTGCVTNHPDADIALTPGYIAGGFTNYTTNQSAVKNGDNTFVPIKYTDGVGEYTFTYDASKAAWGEAKGTINFKLTLDATWATQWGDAKSEVSADFAKTVCPPVGNISISGLTDKKDYSIMVKPEGANVSVKVVSKYTPAELYILDTTKGMVSIPYTAGKGYIYNFKATDTSESIIIWTSFNKKYFKGTTKLDAPASDITFNDEASEIKLTDLTIGDEYVCTIAFDKDEPTKGTVAVEKDLPKLYLAGNAPLTWNLTKDDAIKAELMNEKLKLYRYTFKAESESLDFKIGMKNSWDDAYTNCKDNDGENLTVLDSAFVKFTHANAKNARINGLTKGETYTLFVDASDEKAPKVSIVSGKDILFAIGNDDFGGWKWASCIIMTPIAKGEWKYEFTATNKDAQFKFQTTCADWDDPSTWSAKKAITLGSDYIEMATGGGEGNTSATLAVGTEYILSVKKIGDKYSVKIAKK